MAKDDLGDLADEERDLIRKMRRANREEADTEIWIRDGEKEARMPYGQGRNWLRKWGFLLDDDDLKADPEPEEEPEEEPKDKPVRFAGRRVN